MLCSGAAAEHPAADAPHAGGGEGEELGAAAAAADQAAAADGAAAAGPAPPHPQHAHTGKYVVKHKSAKLILTHAVGKLEAALNISHLILSTSSQIVS